MDFAGTVESVGPGMMRFAPGDEVFGGAACAYSEYLLVAENTAVALRPPEMAFDQAATVAVAGITALQ